MSTLLASADWPARFLAALAVSPNVSAAAQAAGVTRQAAYARRASDPDFATDWDDAVAQSTDALVGACYQRATDGFDEPVFHDGKQCGVKRRFSDQLAITLLKAHRPEVYGDRSQVEIAGPAGGPISVAFAAALDQVYGQVGSGNAEVGSEEGEGG